MNTSIEDAKKMIATRIENYKTEITVLEKIKPLVEKWDKKVLNKRFATALTKECSGLPWQVAFTIYKPNYIRGVNFSYYDSRQYIQRSYVSKRANELVTVDPITMKERINANAWIDNINNSIKWKTKEINKLQAELNDIEGLIARYNDLVKAYNEFRQSLSFDFIDIMEKNYIFDRR